MDGTYAKQSDDLKDKYIIWCPESNLAPTYHYPDRPTAIKVAHILASKNKGKQFAVCKIVGSAKTVQTAYESYED